MNSMSCTVCCLVAILLSAGSSFVDGRPGDLNSNNDLNRDFHEELKTLLDVMYEKLRRSTVPVSNVQRSTETHVPDYVPEIIANPPRPVEVPNWPKEPLTVGQITAVSINSKGQPVIFHRGPVVWDEGSFNSSNDYQRADKGPIAEDTVTTLDEKTGARLSSWGGGMFYMPHGLTVDSQDNVWVTDVALHQVFKFSPDVEFPTLTLGVRFRPGSRYPQLCQPTSVAVARTTSEEIFVADGYCNSRLLEFSKHGELLRVIPQPPEFLSLQVPHSLALLESLNMICVADRENMRIACPNAGLDPGDQTARRPPAATIHQPDLGRVFAVASYGDLVYAVNGPTSPLIPVRGFTIDPRAEAVIDHWGPASGAFAQPHDIAVNQDGSALYVAEIGPNRLWKFTLNTDAAE